MPQRIKLDETKTRRQPSNELATMLKIERIMEAAHLVDSEKTRVCNWFFARFAPYQLEVQSEETLTGADA